MKTFTLDEAQALLPVVEALLNRAIEAKEALAGLEEEQQDLLRRLFLSGGMLVDLAAVKKRKITMAALVQRAKDSLQEIDSIGVQVKDLDTGLLDFPCLLEGETVLLCWKRGEPRIAFWHRMEDGFRGRQPIDGRFRRTVPDKAN
ncbi:MAG TPA: DUF2203 domain-containing protein [Acidobacteriaceae bacterium]|jgi:hypothetical protein|nr:DUF2203 domain-containing protein [Acidobacteriaceae bacterium]